MGNATTICSDKTGTLTKNRMTVVRVYTSGTDFKQPKEAKALDASIVDAIGMSAAINSQFKSLYTIDPKTGLPNQQGNKVSRASRVLLLLLLTCVQTECAILQFADEVAPQTYTGYRQKFPESSAVKVAM